MNIFTVDLKEEYGLQGGTLTAITVDFPWDLKEHSPNWKRPAVIVVPGGGYAMVSKREAEPVAMDFLARGFQAFVLTYEVGGEEGVSYPEQLFELACAVDYVKKHAEKLGVNEEEVFAVGFSAGGHLAGNLAVEWQNVSEKLGKKIDCKPTAVGLSYPVISKINGHVGSYEYLLHGYTDEAKEELLKILNLDEAVSEQTPPAFIWATSDDACVPADNSLRYALALAKQGIAYELHIYRSGAHGLSVASKEINFPNPDLHRIRNWVDDCAKFFHFYTKEEF